MLRVLLLWALPAALCAGSGDTGKNLFDLHCALCHGIGGTGGRGPMLTRPKLARAPDDKALKNVILEGIEPEMPATWFLDDEAAASLAAYVRGLGQLPPEKLRGDAAKGAAVYRAQGCAGCHTLAGSGVPYGPDLSDIGARRSARHLEESLVKPAAAAPEGFLWLRVKTAAGASVQGLRVAETNFTLHLRDARGVTHSFTTAELAGVERLAGKSPMPSYTALSAADRDDLVAYLAAQKGTE